jgi:FMN phosphatase YigB (HAD superfamily)
MHDVVFLFDVDNTLLDNDQVQRDLSDHLATNFGHEARDRYWTLFEDLRSTLGYADYLGTLQRYRLEALHNPKVLNIANWLADYPFADRLYPHALETIAHLRTLGSAAILSDGDVVFQPRKIQRAGLWDALRGEVLIYMHKQRMLVAMQQRYPAAHYVMVDDKPQVLADMKQRLGPRLTTVFVEQGHYAAQAPAQVREAADVRIACIGDLRERKLVDFLPSAPTISLPAG